MRLLVACLIIVGSVLAMVPLRSNSEAFCDTDKSWFSPNTSYTFQYVASSVTSAPGSNRNAGLRIEAKCEVESLGQCQYLLRVSDDRLLVPSPDDENELQPSPNEAIFKNDVEAEDLSFTVINGRIASVSPHASEPVYATNIKRGILSALQLQLTEE